MDPLHLNARAVMNGVMAAGTRLVLAARTGLKTKGVAVFKKARTVIRKGLHWLNDQADLLDPQTPTYAVFHFISMWDHVRFYHLMDQDWPRLEAIGDNLRTSPLIAPSRPR